MKKLNNNETIDDTPKSNLFKFKIVVNIIILCIIILSSVGIYSYYSKLKEVAIEKYDSIYENNEDILTSIDNSTLVLYKESLDKINNKNLTLKEAMITYMNSYSEESDLLHEAELSFSKRKDFLDNRLKNLEYIVLDKDNNEILSKTSSQELKNIVDNSYDEENLKDIYDLYVVIKYDEHGYSTIVKYYGAKYTLLSDYFNYQIDDLFNITQIRDYNMQLNKIKDMTFIYGVPKNLVYNDYLKQRIENASLYSINDSTILIFGFIVGIVLLIISLLIPYKFSKEVIGNKLMFKVPFEINCVIYFSILGILITFGGLGVFTTINGELGVLLNKYYQIFGVDNFTLINILNLGLWFGIFYFILNSVTLLKYIFKNGFSNYMRNNLLTIKIYNFLKNKFIKFFNYLNHIDLKDKSNKAIIKILVINFLILFMISFILGGFGIGIIFIYTVVLFIIITKYYDKVRDNYEKLLKSTNKIAEGNLDFEIDDDLGVFNSFKDELKRIQSGFKKAVDEEVKSQKMKTELISNVSHDLKTPLTSIITYVDLLKNKDISDQDRQSYIDTLDRKSQRLKFLIEDLFEVSKANSGNVKLNKVKMDLVELIKQLEIELSDKFKKSNLILKNNFGDNKIILNLDSQKTFRIFDNLFNNVAKYAMENSRVYIDIVESENDISVTIKNISAVEMNFNNEEIVERFSRGDKSRNTEGSGLGLAIVKSFVELQDGMFNIEIDGDLFKAIVRFNK